MISQRYAGDNYKVYFKQYSSSTNIATATAHITAWKHVHIEKDKLCRAGGLLFKSYGATGECGESNQPPCCGIGSEPPCNQILLYDWTNILNGNEIAIFDESRTIELGLAEIRTVNGFPVNNGDGSVSVTINNPLQHSYYATDKDLNNPPNPIFTNGNSAGACVNNQNYYITDTSELRQTYNDGFVSFHIPMQIASGAGIIPYLSVAFFDGILENRYRFQQIWFQNRHPKIAPDPDYDNYESNYWHLIGASERTGSGGNSRNEANASFIFIASLEDPIYCSFIGPPARDCNITEIQYYIRQTTSHEIVHEFAYASNEIATDWAWCGNSSTPNSFQCNHPDGVPPNNNYTGQYCIMSPMLSGDEDRALAMITDNVHHLDCALLYDQVCHNEPGGRPSLRGQIDPQ